MARIKSWWVTGVFLGMLWMVGCGITVQSAKGKGSDPAWIHNPGEEYAPQFYLVGVGSGDTRAAAEREAMGAIAQVFQAQIRADNRLIEKYTEHGDNQEMTLSKSIRLLTDTSVKSNQELRNIKIVKSHFSTKEGVYYVLAVMDRRETALIYRSQVEKNRAATAQQYRAFLAGPDKLARYTAICRACDLAEINQALLQQLAVITGGGEEPPGELTLARLLEEKRRAAAAIRVKVETGSGSHQAVLRDYIEELVAGLGFRIVEDSPDLTLSAALRIRRSDLKRPDQTEFVRWDLVLDLYDHLNGVGLGRFSDGGREGHVSYAQAETRALREAKQRILGPFRKRLEDYFSSFN